LQLIGLIDCFHVFLKHRLDLATLLDWRSNNERKKVKHFRICYKYSQNKN
jgi:hypothetical protein